MAAKQPEYLHLSNPSFVRPFLIGVNPPRDGPNISRISRWILKLKTRSTRPAFSQVLSCELAHKITPFTFTLHKVQQSYFRVFSNKNHWKMPCCTKACVAAQAEIASRLIYFRWTRANWKRVQRSARVLCTCQTRPCSFTQRPRESWQSRSSYVFHFF